eukprot:TRINITY_DN1822_c0_g2_i1.p1 TRINITY_DN1822_c0_g2~~TRINITY_DN1822_c0_g2_i1.p1  ORF type:complete len:290 (+),score=36.24 TRINITY_DN1822_c0_g2_i1:295-1164(+)
MSQSELILDFFNKSTEKAESTFEMIGLLLTVSQFREIEDRTAFESTLDGLMQLPENRNRDVPLLLEELIHAIRTTEGMSSQGIFRIPAGHDNLKRYKTQISSGDYSVPKNLSCDIPAALLKEFIRTLAEPLIPATLVQACHGLKSVDHSAKLGAILAQIPEVNRNVYFCLMRFLREVATNSETNSMNTSNLAIVFAPNIFKIPDNFTQNDFSRWTRASTSAVEIMIDSANDEIVSLTCQRRVNEWKFMNSNTTPREKRLATVQCDDLLTLICASALRYQNILLISQHKF